MRVGPKRVVLLLILAVCVVIGGLLAMSLFGPSTPVAVSPQTTYLTGPVDQYGRIDYAEALRQRWSEGVTPENNAAVLIWQALGPAEIPPERQPSFFAELGLPPLPAEGDYFVDLRAEPMKGLVLEWMRGRMISPADSSLQDGLPPDPDIGPLQVQRDYQMRAADAVEEFTQRTEHTQHAPWRSEEFPPLVGWLDVNEGPLELVLQASERPRYFSPLIIGDFGPEAGPLISMMLPDAQHARHLARALCQRAMLHVGEGRPQEAWADLRAVHRLARLIGQQGPLVEQLVAIAMDQMALRADAAMLHEGGLSEDELHEIHEFLMNLAAPSNMAVAMDRFERLAALDDIAHVARHGLGDDAIEVENLLLRTGIHWNIPMQMMNRWYDRLAEASSHSTIEERRDAMLGVESELAAIGRNLTPARLAGALLSRGRRSEIVGEMMVALLLPALSAAHKAEDRAVTTLRLIQAAAALAIHRAEHGTYPAAFANLAPDLREELPADPYTGEPFLYEKKGNGYALWSVGPNLEDNRASVQSFCDTIDGEFVAEDLYPRDGNHDDIVLRVPWSPAKPTSADE